MCGGWHTPSSLPHRCRPDGGPVAAPDVAGIHPNLRPERHPKTGRKKETESEPHVDGENREMIIIRPVPVSQFLFFSSASSAHGPPNAALLSSRAKKAEGARCCATRCLSRRWRAVGPCRRKTRPKALDHWTLNRLPPVGRDVISRGGIKGRAHVRARRSRSVFWVVFKGHRVG